MILSDFVTRHAAGSPTALAVVDPYERCTYADFNRLVIKFANALVGRGVSRGDRVSLWLEKSVNTVAVMQAILRIGAVYVPLDPTLPLARAVTTIKDCRARLVVASKDKTAELERSGVPSVLALEPLPAPLPAEIQNQPENLLCAVDVRPDDMAVILYTSGSTGKPKGVCLSHRNVLAFVNWAVEELQLTERDRFSNHAPFNFDLSTLDLYAAFKVGASVHLIPSHLAYAPTLLTSYITDNEISVWYSVPTALTLIMAHSSLEHCTSLRTVIFAGEPFPIKQLRALRQALPQANLYNFYGPTETNVCTFFKVAAIKETRKHPVPIGKACSGNTVWAVKEDGRATSPGEEGELVVEGASVMMGYWGKEPVGSFYKTGDMVRHLEDGNYRFVGRSDDMVKVRGHRIELGEIETALLLHPAINEAAVQVSGSDDHKKLHAYIVCSSEQPNILELKRHCAQYLPRYMIVDTVTHLKSLPRTRNGKIDRLSLLSTDEVGKTSLSVQPF